VNLVDVLSPLGEHDVIAAELIKLLVYLKWWNVKLNNHQAKDVSPTIRSEVKNCWVPVGVAVGSGTSKRVTGNHVLIPQVRNH
jgi:hypothetical protein